MMLVGSIIGLFCANFPLTISGPQDPCLKATEALFVYNGWNREIGSFENYLNGRAASFANEYSSQDVQFLIGFSYTVVVKKELSFTTHHVPLFDSVGIQGNEAGGLMRFSWRF